MKLKRLSQQTFDRLADNTGLVERTREMARAVLVDGRAQSDVATEYGMTKQRIKLAVDVIERAYLQSNSPGTGWVNVELVLPESLALTLISLVENLSNNTDEDVKTKALGRALAGLNSAQRSLA